MKAKVFGIGFHKTGTTSLGEALKVLGYRATGAVGTRDPEIGRTYKELTRELSHEYDAFEDNPWPLVFREMDEMWPDAKFVLTYRDPQKWIASQVKHFGTKVTPMRQLIYGEARGCPLGNEAHYIETYLRHNDDVRAHFSDRPEKLLELNFEQGQGWKELCEFLGCDVPGTAFPHANPAGTRRRPTLLQRLKKKAGSLI